MRFRFMVYFYNKPIAPECNMKRSFLYASIVSFLLVSGNAGAGQCTAVAQFIDLGKKAEKCVSRIENGGGRANDVLTQYNYCTNVRNERDQIQDRMKTLSATTLNACTEKNLQAYSDAATALQRLYQIELQMK